MPSPPGYKMSTYILLEEYGFMSQPETKTESGTTADAKEMHLLANPIWSMSLLVKFDRDEYAGES